jgi:cold shock CspA family protein
MRATGTLRTWNDDRGFGFIAPAGGGRELFVHISAFPRDGSRPTVGEALSYDLGPGKDGKPQAVRVYRTALGAPSSYPRKPAQAKPGRRVPVGALIGLVISVALGVYGYSRYQQHSASQQSESFVPSVAVKESTSPAHSRYTCDGRTHCSQMTSCAEARYFLQNCPGTEMDGNHDGTPCEQQWCRSPFAD